MFAQYHKTNKYLSCTTIFFFGSREAASSFPNAGRSPFSKDNDENGLFRARHSSQLYSKLLAKLCPTLWDSMNCSTPGFPCPSPSPRVCTNSCSLSRWCHPTNSSSVAPFSSCLQSFPASGSFPVNWLLASRGQSIGASASTSVLPMNIQGGFPLALTLPLSHRKSVCGSDLLNITILQIRKLRHNAFNNLAELAFKTSSS